MGNVGLTTRSLDQILEKLCVRSKGHIFRPILMKVGEKTSAVLENGSCRVKN